MSALNQSEQNQPRAVPGPEVRSKPERHRFTADYKRRIFNEASACKNPGQIVAMLRREGRYSFNLTIWANVDGLSRSEHT